MSQIIEKRRIIIATILFTITLGLAFPSNWRFPVRSWQYFLNIVLLLMTGIGWGAFMRWALNKYKNKKQVLTGAKNPQNSTL